MSIVINGQTVSASIQDSQGFLAFAEVDGEVLA
jgi:hypothetical protein